MSWKKVLKRRMARKDPIMGQQKADAVFGEDPKSTEAMSAYNAQGDLDKEMANYGRLGYSVKDKVKADMTRAGSLSNTAQGDQAVEAEAGQRLIGAQTAGLARINALRSSLGLPALDSLASDTPAPAPSA